MNMARMETLLDTFLSLKETINLVTQELSLGDISTFAPVSIRPPQLDTPSLGFYTGVSWFYVYYFEAGRTSVGFLSERANALGLDPTGHLASHQNLIHSFRTYLQHNLSYENRDDVAKRQRCFDWVQIHLDQEIAPDDDFLPNSKDPAWEVLLMELMREAVEFVQILESTLQAISSDEFCQDVMRVWISRVKRRHSSHEWDEIVQVVAGDMGLKFLDVVAFRQRFFEKWNQRLSLLRDDYSFPDEARRLVEQSLISEEKFPLPIDGKDIMERFGLPPGPRIREFLIQAQRIYLESPCGKEDLLSLLRDRVEL